MESSIATCICGEDAEEGLTGGKTKADMLRLFVGNIPHATSEIELRKWFEQHGHEVAFAQVIRDRMTGHSRGFGFVELSSTSDLRGTVEQLNGQSLSGRVLTVNAATPRTPKGGTT